MLPSSSFRRQIFTDETGTFHLGMEKSRGSSVAWQLVAVVDSLGEDESIHAFCRPWFMFTAVADP